MKAPRVFKTDAALKKWLRTEFDETRTEKTLIADGLCEAFVGLDGSVAVYSIERAIQVFRERDGMTEEEAIEFFQFNVLGAHVGSHTPTWISTP